METIKRYLKQLDQFLTEPIIVAFIISSCMILATIFVFAPLIGSVPAILIMIGLVVAIFVIAANWKDDPDDELK